MTAGSPAPARARDDPRTGRRELLRVWLWAASAVAAAIGSGWVLVVRAGGQPPGGDMIGHAATAQWLRTLEWWDWRGWSDWFYGGQAIGVNYPPLGHFWMRVTDPVHGQMAAVAIGLLVLLPWGALRLARAVGYSPRAQQAAVAAVLVLAAAAGNMHWVLSGFHEASTFYGSWPAMIATVVGLHAAAYAARCRRPVTAGVLVGVAGLFNATVIPGAAVVCAVLLVSSGASLRQGVRWALTAGAAGLAVSAWWLVPFVHGWDRLVRWEVPLRSAWSFGGEWQPIALAILGVAAVWAARAHGRAPRRLALAAGAALLATMVADLFEYLRPERWLEMPILVAVIAAAALLGREGRSSGIAARPSWVLVGAAFVVVLAVVTLRVEFLPLAVWMALGDRTAPAAWGGAVGWAAVLLWVPLLANVSGGDLPDEGTVTPLAAAVEAGGPDAAGLVDLDWLYESSQGGLEACAWGHPWEVTEETGGRLRPLFGLYQESSAAAEFIQLDLALNGNQGTLRRHWSDAWEDAGKPRLHARPQAEALGARWYAHCDAEGEVSVTELSRVDAQGAALDLHASEDEWVRAAADWWIAVAVNEPASAAQSAAVPALVTGGVDSDWVNGFAPHRAASGLSVQPGRDTLRLVAETPGWAWVRVPWDPYWSADNGAPVLKGGPGHLIVWAAQGETVLRWQVPAGVDATAVMVTGVALVLVIGLADINRHFGWHIDKERRRPAAQAVSLFSDTVDAWLRSAGRKIRRRHEGSARTPDS